MLLLITGATGKVGQVLLGRILAEPRWAAARIRALCHNRSLSPHARVESIKGSIADRATVEAAMAGVTHVIHMATVKEDPQQAMDVSVKGMFWLLEAFRTSPTAEQFMLIGGDCTVGHISVAYDAPITEASPRRPYPGVYALSKVLEEVMLEQYYVQYDLDGCCLRAPWIMEKDDFAYQLSFGDDVFGGPRWGELVGPARAAEYREKGAIPVMLDPDGVPVKRNFVHVDDLVSAILIALEHPRAKKQTFNVSMDEPVDYGELGAYLEKTRGRASVPITTPFRSTWLDNAKAKLLLGWRPRYDLHKMTDAAFDYQRAPSDPRTVWYPG